MMRRWIIQKLFHSWFLLKRPMTLGVRIIIENNKGEILLVRHTYTPGLYLPGGGIETGEHAHEAAIKEVREETGLVPVGKMELLGIFLNSNTSRRDHVLLYRCRNWEVEKPFEPNNEISEAGFFHPERLPADVTPATMRRIRECLAGQESTSYW